VEHRCWDCAGFTEPDRSNAKSGCRMNDRMQEAKGHYTWSSNCWRPVGSILIWNEEPQSERV